MIAPMLGATRHVSLPVWVVDCAWVGMQAKRRTAATRTVPLAGRNIPLSVCLEFDYSFSGVLRAGGQKFDLRFFSLQPHWTGYGALALTYVFDLKR